MKNYFVAEGIPDFQIDIFHFNKTLKYDENTFFEEAGKKMDFYAQAKKGIVINLEDKGAVLNQEYFENCIKLNEVPLPTFAKFS